MRINVVLASDEKFAAPCMVTIVSILENNKDNDCRIYLLNAGFSKSSIYRFKELSRLYDREIHLIEVSLDKFKNLLISPIYSIVTYFRFLIPEILKDCNKCIYLDSDIIVRHSLTDFWNTDIENKACAVVADQNGDNILESNRLRIKNLHYFNAGVLLMNLNYWRENNLCGHLIEDLQSHQYEYKYYDQDAMNALLYDKVVFVSFKYNFQNELYLKNRYISFEYWDDIDKSAKDPVIIHYCAAIKPWHSNCIHPAKDEYWEYAKKYSFINLKSKHYYSFVYRVTHFFFIRIGNILLNNILKYHI